MRLSHWQVKPGGKLRNMLAKFKKRPLRVLYLDDHSIFREGIISLFKTFFPNVELQIFCNGDEAMQYLETYDWEAIPLDLIITDINHPGMPGNQIILRLRMLELEQFFRPVVPVMVISMVPASNFPFLVQEGMIKAYLSKAAEAEEIIACVEGLLY